MRILYIDCDSLRPDHLGCYGYDRDTSPTVDSLADNGRVFTNYYASDAPCLPSRTALFSARFGIHTGVVNHGGRNADPRPRGQRRRFDQSDEFRTWTTALSAAGYRTALVSPFPTRHGAFHVLDGFEEWYDTGHNGHENADIVAPYAERWLDDHASEDDWYLHVNFWDPHTLYTTPLEYGDPFTGDPAPEWLTEDRIATQREQPGPFSARDLYFYGDRGNIPETAAERMPESIDSRAAFDAFVDGYDTGIRFMDDHIARLLDVLERAGVREETLIVVSADHGENLGELNTYGDHLLADYWTTRVPLIVAGPDIASGTDSGFHYGVDFGPSLLDLAGIDAATGWDGRSFADAWTGDGAVGRDFLVLGNCAWTCQRAVRWDDWHLVRTYHDAYMNLPALLLFDVREDPHETTNLADERPEVVREGMYRLGTWVDERRSEAIHGQAGGNPDAPSAALDPLWEVLAEGGPFHPRGPDGNRLADYAARLRETDREAHADRIERTGGFVADDPR